MTHVPFSSNTSHDVEHIPFEPEKAIAQPSPPSVPQRFLTLVHRLFQVDEQSMHAFSDYCG